MKSPADGLAVCPVKEKAGVRKNAGFVYLAPPDRVD